MDLTDIEKEVLGFLYGRIGSRANATMPLRDLQSHFAEITSNTFWHLSAALIEKGLIQNKSADDVSFSPQGWKIAHALQGKPAIQNPRQAKIVEAPPPNEHLVWDLSRLADYQKAQRFVMHFRKSLCVYSAPVEQLYTNYDIVVPKENQHKLIIMPNPAAHLDTFSNVRAESCVATGMYIVPTAEGELQLKVPLKEGQWHSLPLGDGLNLIQSKLGPDVPFLPVLTKGDLRELTPSQPVLHLHRLILDKVGEHSEMDTRAIRRAIQDNLAEHFGFTPLGKATFS